MARLVFWDQDVTHFPFNPKASHHGVEFGVYTRIGEDGRPEWGGDQSSPVLFGATDAQFAETISAAFFRYLGRRPFRCVWFK
jgi:hypothetical protein